MVRREASFCPDCGVELVERRFEGRSRTYCESCEAFVWRDPVPVAGVAVVDGGRVFLQRRAKPPGEGKWGFPAGVLEYDEQPRAGAARELREETTLRVDPADLSILDAWNDTTGDGCTLWTLFVAAAEDVTGTVDLSHEADEWAYLSPAAFADSDRQMSDHFFERFRTAAETDP